MAMETLGEGDTPLIPSGTMKDTYYKLEGLNPSGSFKDRGTIQVVSEAMQSGTDTLHIVSSGNAAISLAMYCKASGLTCICHVPSSTSTEKQELIESLGAVLKTYAGTYEEVYHTVNEMRLDGVNVTPGKDDTAIAGYAMIATEILEAGIEPDTVIVPCGNGTGLAGIWQGFVENGRHPTMIGVQVDGAAPLKEALKAGTDHATVDNPTDSIAEGIVASESFHSQQAIAAIHQSGGTVETVSDATIQEGMVELLQDGVLCEPTSAAVYSVLDKYNGVTVAIITGSGLKHYSTLTACADRVDGHTGL